LFSRARGPTGDGEEFVDKAKAVRHPQAGGPGRPSKRVKGQPGGGWSRPTVDRRLRGLIFRTTFTSSGNRLSSGSYFPPAVRRVDIPKAERWARARWASRRSRIALLRRVARRYLEPFLERGVFTPTRTATGPVDRRSMPFAKPVSAAGGMTGCSIFDVKGLFRQHRIGSGC